MALTNELEVGVILASLEYRVILMGCIRDLEQDREFLSCVIALHTIFPKHSIVVDSAYSKPAMVKYSYALSLLPYTNTTECRMVFRGDGEDVVTILEDVDMDEIMPTIKYFMRNLITLKTSLLSYEYALVLVDNMWSLITI